MLQLKTAKSDTLCDWCGRDGGSTLVSVTLVTPRGAFRDEICESCRAAYIKTPEDE